MSKDKYLSIFLPQMRLLCLLFFESFSQRAQFWKLWNILGYSPVLVTKKELFRFNIKSDSNCIYFGDLDFIHHTFSECQFTKSFPQEVLQWFNTENNSEFNLNNEDLLFGTFPSSSTLIKKLNYTLLFLQYYIYKKKLQNDSPFLLLSDFINKVKCKYKLEKII